MLDAAAVLQMSRSRIAAELADGEPVAAEVVAHGYERINAWFAEHTFSWAEMLSVRPAATVAQLRVSLTINRALLDGGLQMISLFDHDRVDAESRLLLAAETGTYLFGFAPLQMKLVDRSYVLLQGPVIDDEPSVMAVHSSDCLDAAWRYWEAVIASSFPAADDIDAQLGALTHRQRQIVALLATDTRDDDIATALGVSVRTVRADIAALMEILGVRSRFAAGLRLREIGATND